MLLSCRNQTTETAIASKIDHIVILIGPPPVCAKYNHDAGGGVGTVISSGSSKVFPPLSALYGVSIVRKLGLKVTFIDANSAGLTSDDILNSLRTTISRGNVAIILFGSLVSIPADLNLLNKLRVAFTGVKCCFASTVSHLFQDELFSAGASLVISGDIEASIVSAIRASIPTDRHFRRFLTAKELNDLPYPAWDIAKMEGYTSYTVLSSRGCSIGCPHCPYHVYQRAVFIPRTPSSTLNEIEWLAQSFKPDYFLFRDPCFSYDIERSEAIAKGLISIKPQLSWGCETRPEYLTTQLISSFATGGCHHIRMGIESADESIIKMSRRLGGSLTPKEYLYNAKQVIACCRRYGVYTVCFFMVGFQDDSKGTIYRIREFVDNADPDIALVNYITPYPGTSYAHNIFQSASKMPNDWAMYGSKSCPVIGTKYMTIEELQQEKDDLEAYLTRRNRQFYPIR